MKKATKWICGLVVAVCLLIAGGVKLYGAYYGKGAETPQAANAVEPTKRPVGAVARVETKAEAEVAPTDDGSSRRRAMVDSSFRSMGSRDDRKIEKGQICLMRLGKPGIKHLIEEMDSPDKKRASMAREALFAQWPAAYDDLVVAASCGNPSIEAGARGVLTKMSRVSQIAEEAFKKADTALAEVRQMKTDTASASTKTAPLAPAVTAESSARSSIDLAVSKDNEARRQDRIRYLRNEILDDEGRLDRWRNAQRSVIDPDIMDIRRGEIRRFEQTLEDKKREFRELEQK